MDMFQKIILLLSIFFIFVSTTFATEKVENVFQDIDSNYKYLWELQLLYDQGIIQSNIDNKFNPYELLTREQFVGILTETNCTECIKPHTDFDLVSNYINNSVYYDVNNDSDYFYCINDADQKGHIQWYQAGTICENWDSHNGEIPFCPYNTIILEEALAIVMRAWNILTQNQANDIINEIASWKSYPSLSEDVNPRNIDNSIYDFYPYFYEAQNIAITEYNNLGEKIEYWLLEQEWWKYFPKKSINKEDFLRIATFALKNSSCIEHKNETISGKINTFNSSCDENNLECSFQNTYSTKDLLDINWDINSSCLLWISDNSWYQWIIHDLTNNTESIYTTRYLNDIWLTSQWQYKIDLYVTDLCNSKNIFTKYISVSGEDENSFSATINKKYLEDLSIDFQSIVNWDDSEYSYNWDFWDNNNSTDKNPIHTYKEAWIYDVTLTIIDQNWKELELNTPVNLYDNDFNISIWIENILIGSTEFIKFTWITNSNNPNLIYAWDFWDWNTSDEQNPLHNYKTDWIYNVIFTVTDENGNSKNISTQILIDDSNFSLNISSITQETNNWLLASFLANIQWWNWPFDYLWNFWDWNTSNEQNPTNIYTENWIYDVFLTVTDIEGNIQNTSTQVYVWNNNIYTEINTIPNTQNIAEFSFEWVVVSSDLDWEYTYLWNFWDWNTSNEQNPTNIYSQSGDYQVSLIVTNSLWEQFNSQTNVKVVSNNNLNINIDANPISWSGPLNSYFQVELEWWNWPFIYEWNFADGTTGLGNNIDHIFNEVWTYNVILTVTDSNNIQKNETITIQVWSPISNINIDTDWDTILNENDKCPSIVWTIQNDGCPIFEKTCSVDSDCPNDSKCWVNSAWISTCIAVTITNTCEYQWESTIFWNIICNTCPCQHVLDFNAGIRECDIVFPAITSPDGTELYSKWDYFQIKK